MFRPSTLSLFVYLTPALHLDELTASPLATNGMKLLGYVEQNGGISVTQSLGAFHRKCVEWFAHEFQSPGYQPEILYSVGELDNSPIGSGLGGMPSAGTGPKSGQSSEMHWR